MKIKWILLTGLLGSALWFSCSQATSPGTSTSTSTVTYTLTPGTLSNGTMTLTKATSVVSGAATAIVASANTGYYFTTWTASPSSAATFASANSASTTVKLTANATITPTFAAGSANGYTVTYNANTSVATGSVPVDSSSYKSGTSFYVLGYGTLAYSSHAFVGWNTANDGSGTFYKPGTAVTMGGANVTLYAVWTVALAQWASAASTSGSSWYSAIVQDSSAGSYVVGTIPIGSSTIGTSVTGNSTYNAVLAYYNSSGTAQWAYTCSGSGNSQFYGVARDSSGNIYAVGYITGTNTYTFGTKPVTGLSSGQNPVLVMYNSSGTAQWAATITTGSEAGVFNCVTADSSGYVYVGGYVQGSTTFSVGTGNLYPSGSGISSLLVKYNTSGTAQWAQLGNSYGSTDALSFTGLAGDGTYLYAVGYAEGSVYISSSSTTTDGIFGMPDGYPFVAKFSESTGYAVWAQSFTASSGVESNPSPPFGFTNIAIDSSSNIYAVGKVYEATWTTGIGSTISLTTPSSAQNGIIVKYNSSGAAQWAQTITSSTSGSNYFGVSLDSSGNVYVVGQIAAASSNALGNSIVANAGAGNAPILVKYNSTGNAQWYQTVFYGGFPSDNMGQCSFNGVFVDSSGNSYVIGKLLDSFNFGNSVTASSASQFAALIIKYKYN